MRSEGCSTWSVCVCVSLAILALQARRGPTSNYQQLWTNDGLKNKKVETTLFKRYGMKTSNMLISTGVPWRLLDSGTVKAIRSFTMDRRRIQRCFKHQLIEQTLLAQQLGTSTFIAIFCNIIDGFNVNICIIYYAEGLYFSAFHYLSW